MGHLHRGDARHEVARRGLRRIGIGPVEQTQLGEPLDELEREFGTSPVVLDDRRSLGSEEFANTVALLALRIRQQLLVFVESGRQLPPFQVRLRRFWQRHCGGHGFLSVRSFDERSCLQRGWLTISPFGRGLASTIRASETKWGCRVYPRYCEGQA